MSVQTSRAAIAKAVQDLLVRWIQTRGEWDDVVADQFEKQFLEPIQQDVKPAGTAMDTMGGLVAQMKRDCSE